MLNNLQQKIEIQGLVIAYFSTTLEALKEYQMEMELENTMSEIKVDWVSLTEDWTWVKKR